MPGVLKYSLDGTNWLELTAGPKGDQGVQGLTGPTGPQGVPGAQGVPGELTEVVADTLYEAKGGLLKDAIWWVDAASCNRVGYNLLTANQASGTDTLGTTAGFGGFQCTAASSSAWAAQGTKSVAFTCSLTATGAAMFHTNAVSTEIPVVPGQAYTFSCIARQGVGTRQVQPYLNWFTSAGVFINNPVGPNTTISASGTLISFSKVAPANAAYVTVEATLQAGAVNDVVYFDSIGLWAGVGGTWAMPGNPITVTPDRLPDLTGRGRDAIFAAGASAPILLPHTGEDYIRSPDTQNTNGVLSPAIDFQIGDTYEVDFRSMDSVTANPSGYLLLATAGHSARIQFSYVAAQGGWGYLTANYPTAATGQFISTTVTFPGSPRLSDGKRYKISVTFGPTSATAIINGVSYPGTAYVEPIFSNTSTFGLHSGKTWPMEVYSAGVIRNGVPLLALNPSRVNADLTTIPDQGTKGGVWGMNRATSGFKAVVVDRPLLLCNTDSSIVSTNMPDVPAWTALFSFREWGQGTNYDTIMTTRFNANAGGFILYRGGSGLAAMTLEVDADDGSYVSIPVLPANSPFSGTIGASYNPATGKASGYTNGVLAQAWLLNPASSFSDKRSIEFLAEVEFIAAAFFDRALTDAEIAQVSQDLAGVPHTQQADPHPQYAVRSTVGNLLTANQASRETDQTGFIAVSNCTLAPSAYWFGHGTYSMMVTATGSSPEVAVGNPRVPVAPGTTITATVTVNGYAIPTRSAQISVKFYTAATGGVMSGGSLTATGSVAADSPRTLTVTGAAPQGYLWAQVHVSFPSGISGEIFLVDKFGLWAGAGGDWAMPGTPIPHLGTQVTHPNTDDVLAQVWDAGKAQWQTVHYDSGQRNITALVAGSNGWTGAASVRLRRTGNTVVLTAHDLARAAPAVVDTIVYPLPAGFRNLRASHFFTTTTAKSGYAYTNGNVYIKNPSVLESFTLIAHVGPDELIPVSLPGTMEYPGSTI